MDYEIDLNDPMGSLIEHADRFLSSQKGELVSTLARALGNVLRPGASPVAMPPPQRPQATQPPPPPPPAPPPQPVKENARDVLGFDQKVKLTKAMVKERQRTLAKLWHPDHGGSIKAMQRLNEAVNELLKTI